MTTSSTAAVTARPTPPGVGDLAPSFSLVDQHGVAVALDRLVGPGAGPAAKHVVLVFYPFAFSGICTSELREIRDHLEDFEGDDLVVLAISCDSLYSLRVFADSEGYFFPLLSDFWPHGAVASAYGVFDDANGFAIRGTFLVDRTGVVRWTLVNEPGMPRDFDGFRAAMTELRAASPV